MKPLESLIKDYNRHRKPDVMAKLLSSDSNSITVRFSGLRPEDFLDDFRSEIAEKTRSKLLLEKMEKDNGNRVVRFSVRDEKGPADDILEAISKYYEGVPPPKAGRED